MTDHNDFPEDVLSLLESLKKELRESYSESDKKGNNFFNGHRILSKKQRQIQQRIKSIHGQQRLKSKKNPPRLSEKDLQQLKEFRKQLREERRRIFLALPKSVQREIAYNVNWYFKGREMTKKELELENKIKRIQNKRTIQSE